MKKILLAFFIFSVVIYGEGFYAYCTRISPTDSVSGRYEDVVVSYRNNGRFIFSRQYSYFPIWQIEGRQWSVKKIVPFNGDGDKEKPDKYDLYCYAEIVKNTPEKIIVRLRYIPDFNNVGFDGVVYELYTLTPNGKVDRKIKCGTSKFDDWIDPRNFIEEVMECDKDGLKEISLSRAELTRLPGKSIKGNPIITKISDEPLEWWKFDEGLKNRSYKEKDITIESIHNIKSRISGPKSFWKEGVSGTALEFDGYNTGIRISNKNAPSLEKSFTISSWIALGAYPFNWAPVMERSVWGKKGFYFGINEKGYPGFHVAVGDNWYSLVSNHKIKLFFWYYIAVEFDSKKGTLNLFINGSKSASKQVPPQKIISCDNDLYIGLNSEKMPAIKGRIKIGKWPSFFGLDGLLDEIKIYDRALTSTEIYNIFSETHPSEKIVNHPDMEVRKFPVTLDNHAGKTFGAEYTKLKYYESWDDLWRLDDYSDVVVNFDLLPVKIISWHGFSYGPVLVSENNKWAGDQSSENYRELNDPSPAEGCCEHMSDKECRFSHITIIENTDARVVLHWRYALVDSRYTFVKSGHSEGDWADEYWTIYPDGTAIRYLKRGKIWSDSWVETMIFNEPGTRPEDNVNLNAYSLMNMAGTIKTYSWKNGSPKCDLPNPIVSMINLKAKYHPFNIYPTGSEIKTFPGHNNLSHFHWWNHFPISQITSDGRSALAPDRASHSSLVWGIPSKDFLMYGFTDQSVKSLMPLAKSWNNPPKITNTSGCISLGYKQSQRVYFIKADRNDMSFTLHASPNSPVVNPAFVIENISSKSKISINGKINVSNKNVRQGLVRNIRGKLQLVIWIKYDSIKPVNIRIVKNVNE